MSKDKKHYILGADPGKHGAIVLINKDDVRDQLHFPTKVTKEGEIDYIKLWDTLNEIDGIIDAAAVEHVHALDLVSAKSTFSFGEAYGSLRALLLIMGKLRGFPLYCVYPKDWQHIAWSQVDKVQNPAIGADGEVRKSSKGKVVMKTDTKATSLSAAKKLFPGVSFIPPRCRNEHDGLFDAALIAYYAKVMFCDGIMPEDLIALGTKKKRRKRPQKNPGRLRVA